MFILFGIAVGMLHKRRKHRTEYMALRQEAEISDDEHTEEYEQTAERVIASARSPSVDSMWDDSISVSSLPSSHKSNFSFESDSELRKQARQSRTK
jgi:hypothetical protein